MKCTSRKKYILSLFVVFSFYCAKANPDSLQRSNPVFLSFGTGYGTLRYLDPHESLKVKSGKVFPFSLEMDFLAGKGMHSVFVSKAKSILDEKSLFVKTESDIWQLDYSYFQFFFRHNNFRYYLGVKGSGRFFYKDISYDLYEDGIKTTGINLFCGLLPGIQLFYDSKKRISFFSAFSIAIGGVSFFQRYDNELPYSSVEKDVVGVREAFDNAYWSFFNNFKWLTFTVGAINKLNKRVSLAFKYTYDYARIPKFENEKKATIGLEVIAISLIVSL